MAEERCLLSIHAHPDDESSKGASTIARYHAEGVHTVLVTATGGEEGDILNPAMDRPEVRENLPAIRRAELESAVAIIGYDELVWLGYRDSGMPDSPSNENPSSFAQADLDEATGRLVAIIRRVRPQVILTYGDESRGYRHPDHVRVHEISVAAYHAAGDPDRYPELGEPYQPQKLYYSGWARETFLRRHEKFLELGLESPYTERIEKGGWLERREDNEPTTFIDVTGYQDVRRRALLAHETQIDPLSPHWFGLPEEVESELHRRDVFVLADSTVPTTIPEDDLFAGVRTFAAR
jgi:mycothiol S-conjugate amidase